MVLQQLRHHLGVRLGLEGDAQLLQMFLDFQIVFDDAVVDNGNTAVFADMGVGIDVVGFPVSGPTGMADAQVALQVRTAVDQVS